MKLDMRFAWSVLRIFALLVTVAIFAKNSICMESIGYGAACILTWFIAIYNEKSLAKKEK